MSPNGGNHCGYLAITIELKFDVSQLEMTMTITYHILKSNQNPAVLFIFAKHDTLAERRT